MKAKQKVGGKNRFKRSAMSVAVVININPLSRRNSDIVSVLKALGA